MTLGLRMNIRSAWSSVGLNQLNLPDGRRERGSLSLEDRFGPLADVPPWVQNDKKGRRLWRRAIKRSELFAR